MLTRVRVGFALLACLLLVPLGVLIARSFESLERERDLQHASVANRVFDEAERALVGFVREEQARPADEYRNGLRPTQPFVLGYFQVDRSGRFELPYAQTGRESELRTAVQRFAPPPAEAPLQKKLAEAKSEPAERFADAGQAPGTARNVQSLDLLTDRKRSAPAPEKRQLRREEEAKSGLSSSTAALERLGEIAKSKARDEIVAEADAPAPSVTFSRTSGGSADAARDDAAAQLELGRAAEPPAANAPVRAASRAKPEIASEPIAPAPAPDLLAARPNIAPSRLSGERVDAARMLLYRTALLDDGVPYRQGLWVDLEGLGEWLRERVLGESELRDSLELVLLSAEPASGPTLPDGRFIYEYRFAEPFDGLQARLSMTPLGD